jgi:hypothetical protein
MATLFFDPYVQGLQRNTKSSLKALIGGIAEKFMLV